MSVAVLELAARKPVLPRFTGYGIGILESRHADGFEMISSRYDFSEIILILDGQGTISLDHGNQSVRKNDIIIIPAGTVYYFEDAPRCPLAMLSLCIRDSCTLTSLFSMVLPEEFQIFRRPIFLSEAASHLRAIIFELSRPGSSTQPIVTARTLLLLGIIARQGKDTVPLSLPSSLEQTDILDLVRNYVTTLEHTFHESETDETIASKLGISPRTLSHYFRQATGTSRHKYIQGLRLRHATKMLSESDQPITSIAFACGFEDISTFFRAFRALHQCSPGQWREQHRPS